MKKTRLNIIEPTLSDQSGHCYSYVKSLVDANEHARLNVWINQQGASLFDPKKAVIHSIFHKRWRKLQLYFLYRRLLKRNEAIFVPTAGRIDMAFLSRLQKKRPSQSPIHLHFHQFNQTPKKIALLEQWAQSNPHWHILAPTERLLSVFKNAGFKHCTRAHCPSFAPNTTSTPQAFSHLLFAGAARHDKGFSHVCAFAAFMNTQKQTWPLTLQISTPSSGRYDTDTEQSIKLLHQTHNPLIRLNTNTLDQAEYLSQFQGSICLLLYSPSGYADKFSGVTLDAIFQGAPIITVANTWMGDTVQRYDLGVVLTTREASAVYQAAKHIVENYSTYQENCFIARNTLKALHDPKNTLDLIERAQHTL
jgi:hypothetical protein